MSNAARERDGAIGAANARAEHDRAGALRQLDDMFGARLDVSAVLVWKAVRHRLHESQIENGLRRLGNSELHVAGAGAHRREGGHRRRAGETAGTAGDHHGAGLELVPRARTRRDSKQHPLADQAGRRRHRRAAWNPDGDDFNAPGMRLARLDIKADLRPMESGGDIGLDSVARSLAGGCADARRDVAGHDYGRRGCARDGCAASPRVVDRPDSAGDGLAWLAFEASSEHRVDDHG